MPGYGNLFIIWLAVCFSIGRQLAAMASSDLVGYDPTSNALLGLSTVISLACAVMYIVWAFKARAAPRHYALNTFHFDLRMNAFYTVLFNVFYITYCINDMPQALAKHRIIHQQTQTTPPHLSRNILFTDTPLHFTGCRLPGRYLCGSVITEGLLCEH